MHEALLYEKKDNNDIECHLCNHRCKIKNKEKGVCRVRENRNGTLGSLVYNLACSTNVDPIEKKPLFHFLPGSKSFSIATVGCNFSCKFCQNWEISQCVRNENRIFGSELSPEEIVRLAKAYNAKSISYTYTEPTVSFEYAYDTARLAKKEGILNTFVTNGYMTKEAIDMISPYLDGANVDLKSFSDDFYKRLCGARLEGVLSSIRYMKEKDIWVEVTTLLIPGENSSKDELSSIASFIKEIGIETPWHISRFYPNYKFLNTPPTPISLIQKAVEIGEKTGLRYVYGGNIPGDSSESTYCYSCRKMLIKRFGFSIIENNIKKDECPNCGAKIDGIFE